MTKWFKQLLCHHQWLWNERRQAEYCYKCRKRRSSDVDEVTPTRAPPGHPQPRRDAAREDRI